MSNEILSVLQYMEKEKGIPREDMISAIAGAIVTAAQKGFGPSQNLKVDIDPKTGSLKAWNLLAVVDSVSDPASEIHIEKARAIKPGIQIGETIEKEIDPSHLGRIAAQAAKQAIVQRIRQFEKDRLYEDFKSSIGDIVSGVVRRRDRSDLFIDLGKTEAILPAKERIPGEEYAPGDRIRCLLLNIESTPRGPELILTRSHPTFVKRLFELEVSEIADGTVTIEGIAREAGYRTKIAVQTHDPKVDPVGACVGARGARVKTIVRELGGEKIDIVRYFSDPRKMLEEAISPAIPKNIRVDEANRRIYFEVAEGDLSIAIGRKGQNAKLTSKLLGWRLDIGKESGGEVQFEERLQRAVEGINQIPGIGDDEAQILVNNGITSIEAFEGVNVSDLVDLGFTEDQANNIIAKVKAFRKN